MVLVDILIFSILGTIANYLSFAKLPALLVFPISLHFAVAVICISRWGLCGIIPFVFSEIVPPFFCPGWTIVGGVIASIIAFISIFLLGRFVSASLSWNNGLVSLLVLFLSEAFAVAIATRNLWGLFSQLILRTPSLLVSLCLLVALGSFSGILACPVEKGEV